MRIRTRPVLGFEIRIPRPIAIFETPPGFLSQPGRRVGGMEGEME
jgi:hypothetical protein